MVVTSLHLDKCKFVGGIYVLYTVISFYPSYFCPFYRIIQIITEKLISVQIKSYL